jgi:hypothetical protein
VVFSEDVPHHEEMTSLTVGVEYEGSTDIDLCRMEDRENPNVLASLFGLSIVPEDGTRWQDTAGQDP